MALNCKTANDVLKGDARPKAYKFHLCDDI